MIATVLTADLGSLVPAWTALWSRTPTASPFQHPGWLLAWWRQFGSERPVIAVLHRGDELVGVLPCYVLSEAGGAKLLPIGVSLSDHHDALIAPDAPDDTASLLLAAVLAATPDVATCDLVDLAPEAALRRATPPPAWRIDERPGEPCPVLVLPPGAGFADVVPAPQRRKLRMNRHRADRLGGATLRFADAHSLASDLDALIALQRARRRALGETGVDPEAAAFLHRAAPALLAAGRLHLATLEIAGARAAACLAFPSPRHRLLFYMSGFDARFEACSPGTLLLGAMIEEALRDEMGEVHFLRGGEAYKYAWGGVDRRNIARRFERLA